ncbi:hypothetical protein, partial [Nostoc sp. NMS4]|uniref:hypothetical protein n=1 Tax=Nostoc sp. NMS4 TaxID=2815390 RepID=UPI0025CF5BD1
TAFFHSSKNGIIHYYFLAIAKVFGLLTVTKICLMRVIKFLNLENEIFQFFQIISVSLARYDKLSSLLNI